MITLRTLADEDALREALNQLNFTGMEPSFAGVDGHGLSIIVAYEDAEGELPIVVVRDPGEDAEWHEYDETDGREATEHKCGPVYYLGESYLRWPIQVMDPFEAQASDVCRCDHWRCHHTEHGCVPGDPCWCDSFMFDHRSEVTS